jgi:hypothetical protein
VHINAEQVSFEGDYFSITARCAVFFRNTPGSMVLQIVAIPGWSRRGLSRPRGHGDNIAGTAAVEHRSRSSGQYNAPIDPDRSFVFARREFNDVAILSAIEHSLQRLFRNSRQRLRTGEASGSGGQDRRRNDA